MLFNLLIGFIVRSKYDSWFFIMVILYVCCNFCDIGSKLLLFFLFYDDMFKYNYWFIGLLCLLCIIYDYGNSEWNLCSKILIIKIMLFIFFVIFCIVRVRLFE